MLQEVEDALRVAHLAQQAWAGQVVRRRLKAVGRIAQHIAQRHGELTELIPRTNASPAEILASELFPLADACRYTASIGNRVLAADTRSMRWGAWWMGRIGVTVTREPWGTLLILAPTNYPLFLPGVQIIQAVAAGNAVLVKPAPGCEAVLQCFHECLVAAGVPADLVQVLDSSIEAGQRAIELGVDKLLLTGSVTTARSLLPQLSAGLTPSTLELSGCDAVFVSPQADVKRVASCVAYGLTLNGGASCIAPRRIFVTPRHAAPLLAELVEKLKSGRAAPYGLPAAVAERVAAAVAQAQAGGAEIAFGSAPDPSASQMQPIVLTNVRPEMEVARADLFAPLTSIIQVEDMPAALQADSQCPYSLGASVFGPQNYAEHWARRIEAGCVVINDIIVPTGDPRVSFGGRHQSGWGVTRGIEGLLEMTRPKTVCSRYGNWLPHLDPKSVEDKQTLTQLLQLFHAGSLRQRLAAIRTIVAQRKR